MNLVASAGGFVGGGASRLVRSKNEQQVMATALDG